MRARPWIISGLALLATGILIASIWASTDPPARAATPRTPPATRAVLVVAAPVETRDVPLYLEGLGTVIAYRTVTVRTQVDGRLDSVSFREGQNVRRGQVLAQIDPRPFLVQLQQAHGALVRDRAQLQNARRNLRRYQRLVAERLIAQQQVDEQRAVVGQYAGAVEIDQAQVQSAQLNIEYARITSPTDGVTGVRLIDSGNVVHAGDPNGIVVVTQLDPIAVLFSLPQNQLVDVSRQLSQGPLPVEAFSQDGQTRLSNTGHLELIDNQINPATATLRLKAVFANPERVLWPNQFVKVRLLLATDRGALVVPAAAIQHGPEGDFVYVVAGDQTAHVRRVQVKRTAGELAIVANGLQAGERVVTEGQNQLQPGSRVAVRTPGAGPNQASAPDHAPGQVQPQPRTQGRTPR